MEFVEFIRKGLNEKITTEKNSKIVEAKYHMQNTRQRFAAEEFKKKKTPHDQQNNIYPEEETLSISGMFRNSKEVSMVEVRQEGRAVVTHCMSYCTDSKWNGKPSHVTYDGNGLIPRLPDI